MDYEKKYRVLVEAVKELQEANPSDEGIQKWVEDNVPELKESEDERIRKKIIATIHLYYGEPLEDEAKEMIAWLEKRGETFTKKDVDDAYLKGVCDAKQELEKQSEQNSARSEEDYNEIETIACHLDNIGNEGMAEVLRNIRDKYHYISQAIWLPSDEQMKALNSAIHCYAGISPTNNREVYTLGIMEEQLKKLKG